MNVVELLQELRRLKVKLSVGEDKLLVDAPAGVIDGALASAIKTNKAELLELLKSIGDGEGGEKAELTSAPDENRLSLTQERIWAIDQLNPGSSQFNLPGGWWLDGELQLDVLARAIAAFESRHDIFRRRFLSENGRPRVSPPEHPGVDLRIMTLQEIGLEEEDSERLTHWFEEISAEPFDLAADALLRVVVLSLSENRHLLSVVSHSIVWDAWCYDIFLSEVGKNYEALLSGAAIDAPEHQYTDYVRWQRINQERPATREALEQAIAGLESYGKRLSLPAVHPAGDQKNHTGARFNFDIPVDLRERLRAFTRKMGVTPFMVFLSAYAYLLCRYAGNDKVLITIPLRGRERREFEAIPGPFTNNLFFPLDAKGHRFSTLLAHVKQETGRTFGGEVPSFERLIEAINQNLAESAFFQLQFSYQNVENRGTHWAEGIRMSAGPAHGSENAHAEISFWMREGKDNMDGAIDYRTSLFDEAFIAEFFERLLAFIEAAIATPDAMLQDLDFTSAADAPSTETAAPAAPANTLEELGKALAGDPEETVLVTRSTTLGAGELLRCLDGVQSVEAGGYSTPILPLVRAIRDLAADRVHRLAPPSKAGRPPEPGHGDPDAPPDGETRAGFSIQGPGGRFSGEAVHSAIAAWRERFAEPCESVLLALPGQDATGVVASLAVLASGRRLCLPSRAEVIDEVSLLSLIRQQGPQLVVLSSPMMEALLELDHVPTEPDYLVWAMPGASRLKRRIADTGLKIRYLLASEATLGVGLIGSGDGWPLCFEQRESAIVARVLDTEERAQLSGLNGRLELTLPGVTRSRPAPRVTVRRDREGTIFWPDTDRQSEAGIDTVTAGLTALDSVRDAYVEVRPSGADSPSTIAWIEQELRSETTTTEIRRSLRRQGVRPPSVIMNVDQIKRDRNRHVLRDELDHPDRVAAHSRFEPPATDREIAFAGVWKDVLSIDRIGVNDTFANLGGSSVQALVILSETQKRLGVSFEPRLLFFQSLKQIAERFPEEESMVVPE